MPKARKAAESGRMPSASGSRHGARSGRGCRCRRRRFGLQRPEEFVEAFVELALDQLLAALDLAVDLPLNRGADELLAEVFQDASVELRLRERAADRDLDRLAFEERKLRVVLQPTFLHGNTGQQVDLLRLDADAAF